MGHALVALSLPGSDKVHKVSIIPRGIGSLGYTIQRPTEDRFLMTRAGAGEQDGGAARRPRRRAPRVRRVVHRRRRRSCQGDRYRAQHRHALRHDRRARPDRLREGQSAAFSKAVPQPIRPIPSAPTARKPRARSTPPSRRSSTRRSAAPSTCCAPSARCWSAAPACCSSAKRLTRRTSSPCSGRKSRCRPMLQLRKNPEEPPKTAAREGADCWVHPDLQVGLLR